MISRKNSGGNRRVASDSDQSLHGGQVTSDIVMGALIAARDYLRRAAQSEPTYGYFHGGDPRDFSPDAEVCTEAELAAHKEACERWERGERPEYEKHHHDVSQVGNTVVAVSYAGAFGLGTYQWRDEDAEDALDQVEAAIAAMTR